MRISVLTPDASTNCLGRAYLLAKILQRHHEVTIVGPMLGNGIWEPIASLDDVKFRFVKVSKGPIGYWQLKQLLKAVTGDVIYASKPLFTSFGMGLLKKLADGKPLVLDIDDWERGFPKQLWRRISPVYRFLYAGYSTLYLYQPISYWNSLVCEHLTRFADAITVSNDFLKKKFGGTIIWHARDTEYLNPDNFSKARARKEFGIEENKQVVMFLGTPGQHKGIEDLITAMSLLERRDAILVLGGIGGNRYSKYVIARGVEDLGERFKVFGMLPWQKVPAFLALSDVIVIPQRKNYATLGQIPAKVFDAMAMAKPIVATAVSELPVILDGCGWIVKPENPGELAEAISYVLEHPGQGEERGWRAREKCIENYSWDAIEETLIELFRKFEK